MKNKEKAFMDYCKGYTFSEIAKKRNVSLATVKTWSQRGLHGKKWNELKAECMDVDTGEVNLKKASKLCSGNGNLLLEGPFKKKMPIDIPNTDENVETVGKILRHTLKHFYVDHPVNDEDVKIRVEHYFMDCMQHTMIPTIEGLRNSLGIVESTFIEWRAGKKGTVRAQILKNACQCIQEMDAQLSIVGKMPQLIYMFRAKNFYGMKDQVEQSITVNDPLGDKRDKSEILNRLNSLNGEEDY